MCKKKCELENRIEIAGYELDPCIYEEIETYENRTVHIMKCKKCGNIDIEWEKNEE